MALSESVPDLFGNMVLEPCFGECYYNEEGPTYHGLEPWFQMLQAHGTVQQSAKWRKIVDKRARWRTPYPTSFNLHPYTVRCRRGRGGETSVCEMVGGCEVCVCVRCVCVCVCV